MADTKDWTWVLQRACDECGFDASGVQPADVVPRLRRAVEDLRAALAGDRVRERPAPEVWSPLEYGCHVRDVCRVFDERLRLMLETEAPAFANWDQDETAEVDRYGEQDPAVVRTELAEAVEPLAARFLTVHGGQWDRTGLRSDGARFTVATLGQYLVHDPVHHVFDVTGTPQT